ncbi:MAG: hypothetical protein AAFP76_15125, partial [Bacteroidota bacterium]
MKEVPIERYKWNTVSFRVLVAVMAGLYPFLHFYGNNYNIADSWPQFFYLLGLCVGAPSLLAICLPWVFKMKVLSRWQPYALTALNLAYFTGLLGLLIFHFNKWVFAVAILCAFLASFILYRFLKKILILQMVLALLSLYFLVSRVLFVFEYDPSWTALSKDIENVQFKTKPNIYLIQPDGYANFSQLRYPPYNHPDLTLEQYLEENGFVNYPNARSNYFTTLTSNSATFAMKHHYYGNIDKNTAKTYGTQEVIVGDNVTLRILDNNGYNTHLFTDNLFFLLNRKREGFDFCNVPNRKISYHKLMRLKDVDIVSDFEASLKNSDSSVPHFYFIEKTVPGHIRNNKWNTRGKEIEREKYLERMGFSDDWLEDLIELINQYDSNPLIVINADHGGYVGLDYLSELDERKLNAMETSSIFTVLMSVKWPNNDIPEGLTMKTNVNLFRNIFYYLSEDKTLLESYQEDTPRFTIGTMYLDHLRNGAFRVISQP